MTKSIVVNKHSQLKLVEVKDFDNLYKLCGFKSSTDFVLQNCWENIKYDNVKYDIYFYAKNKGKNDALNKYDLPPPVDNELYYGSILFIVCDASTKTPINLTTTLWEHLYEELFEGFEDVDSDENDEVDDLDDVDESRKTADGYLKDGFIVDDDEVDSGEHSTEDDTEDTDYDDDDDEESELEFEQYSDSDN